METAALIATARMVRSAKLKNAPHVAMIRNVDLERSANPTPALQDVAVIQIASLARFAIQRTNRAKDV